MTKYRRLLLLQLAVSNGHTPRWWWSGRRLLRAATTPTLTPVLCLRRAEHYAKQADHLRTRPSEFNAGLALGYRIAAEDLRILAGDFSHVAVPGVYPYSASDDAPTDPGRNVP